MSTNQIINPNKNGLIYNIDELYEYFVQQYEKAPFRMLAHELPNDFTSKEDVDLWIETFTKVSQYALKNRGHHVEDDDDF